MFVFENLIGGDDGIGVFDDGAFGNTFNFIVNVEMKGVSVVHIGSNTKPLHRRKSLSDPKTLYHGQLLCHSKSFLNVLHRYSSLIKLENRVDKLIGATTTSRIDLEQFDTILRDFVVDSTQTLIVQYVQNTFEICPQVIMINEFDM